MARVCLDGSRSAADDAGVLMSPEDPARSAAEAVAAGAASAHVRPRTPCGRASLSPRVVGPAPEAIRARVPVPAGVTTGARTEPGPAARLDRVRSWAVPPGFASVDRHETGAEEVAAELPARGVGVEAGLRPGTRGAARFAASPPGPRVLGVLAGVTDPAPATAEASARTLPAEPGAAHGRPVLPHGEEGGTRPAVRPGPATRAGLEDTLLPPDGRRAGSNARPAAEAVAERARSRRP
ncbi:3-keto-5-aminohexanoate cleavage protein [Streptomyces eurythermus]|uniref:3-keto-5-aminohexanoate cleavage protein n=1 Tax=Streptomyces eurythermus TaxID=42237 RepID=UPI0036D2A0DB